MGSPKYPTLAQIAELKRVGTLEAPEPVPVKGGQMTLTIPSSGLAVVEIQP